MVSKIKGVKSALPGFFQSPHPSGMADHQEHSCVGGVSMPLEDGHDKCVLCLGHKHTVLSRENPQSCMDCFICLQVPERVSLF